MKLELKHLAPYFIHNLNVIINNKQTVLRSIHCGESVETTPIVHGYKYCALKNIKPILRPLSDLIKEIEHDGENFVPLKLLQKISGAFEKDDNFKSEPFRIIIEDGNVIGFKAICVNVNQIELFNKLLEWHFDVFGLIEQGLAIDINTLNK